MTDDLRTRIAIVQQAHVFCLTECSCSHRFAVSDTSQTAPFADWKVDAEWEWSQHVADAVIRELTEVIPPIVATAIQSYAQSELAAMSYHGGSRDAFEAMEKMNGEAAQIARYATTHEDWNG